MPTEIDPPPNDQRSEPATQAVSTSEPVLMNHSHHAHTGSGASMHDEHGITFWIGLALGLGIVGFGVRGALHQFTTYSQRFVFAKYAIGFDLLHDVVIAPIAFVVGFVVSRLTPSKFRAPIAFGMFATAILIGIGWYPLQGSAKYKNNVSFQSLNYARSLAIVLLVVWTISGIWAVRNATRKPSSGSSLQKATR